MRARTIAVLGALVAVAVSGFFAIGALTGDDDGSGGTLRGPAGATFKISYPDRWRPLPEAEFAALPGSPVGVLRRKDDKGIVVIRRESGRTIGDFDRLARQLQRELAKRIPDFVQQSSKTVDVRAGRALFTSYIRKRRGTVHTLVVVPARGRSYTLNTTSRGGSDDVAREIAMIILSFDV